MSSNASMLTLLFGSGFIFGLALYIWKTKDDKLTTTLLPVIPQSTASSSDTSSNAYVPPVTGGYKKRSVKKRSIKKHKKSNKKH